MTSLHPPAAPAARRRRTLALVLAAGLALAPAACSDDDGTTAAAEATTTEATPTTAAEGAADDTTDTTEAEAEPVEPVGPVEVAAPGTFAVGSIEAEVVDDTRVTAAQGGEPELPQRTLPTLVLYPASGVADDGTIEPDAEAEAGPWPVVVFSHGLGGEGPNYVATLRVWASAGYVVLAPTYPLSNTNTPGGAQPLDIPEQTADVAHLIDWAIEQGEGGDGPLAGLVDPELIGIGGHSLGGFTSLGAAYNPCCLDERVDAVAEWAGAYIPALGDDGGEAIADGPPLLIVHGDDDRTVPYDRATSTRDAVASTVALVTLVDGPHIPPFVQGLGDPQAAVVTSTTLAFFDQYLKGDPEGLDRLTEAVDEAGPELATVELLGD